MVDKWLTLHRYNRLVRRGEAKALSCPDCGEKVTMAIGEDEEPVLWCVFEDTRFLPGSQFWHDVDGAVAKYTIW